LFEIANDLTEALLRFEKNDYEESIKFFRKVIEGLKNYIKEKTITIVSEDRDGEIYKVFRLFFWAYIQLQ
jgi:hypothetical protein